MPRRAPAGDGSPTPRPVAVSPPHLVGRDTETDELTAALAKPGALVLIEGEAGIGKTRLVREFLASPAGLRHRPLIAPCPPAREPFTLGPLIGALRQATPAVGELGLTPLAGTLRPLFPEWATDLPPDLDSLDDATAARHRIFRALAELMDRLRVTVLVLEDAHWADEVTLEFLLFLAAGQRRRMSLVITYRPDEVPALLRRLSSRLPGGAAARIELHPLDASGIASLVSSMLGGERVSEEFAAFLHERTDGLPLAVEESVRLLHERTDLIRHAGHWERRSLHELMVPPTVRDSVLERASRLTPAAVRVLQAVAVLADPAPEQALIAVAGLPGQQARAGLAAAVGCGLLHENERGQVTFRHVLACRAVYEAIPASDRRHLHLRAARTLKKLTPTPVAHLARHFREAGQDAEWRRYAEQAADLALAVGDESAAAALLHDLIAHAALPAEVVLRLTRKVPLYGLPRYGCLNELNERLRAVLDADGLTSAQQAEASNLLARVLLNAGQYTEGVAELERAIPGLADRPVEAARAMARLGWPGRTLWPAAEHRRWLDQAAATMASTADIPSGDRAELTVNRATALLQLGDPAGWELAAEIPETAADPREWQHIARGCMNIGDSAMQWGRYRQAHERLAAGLELCDQHDYPRLRLGLLVTLAHLDWFTGRWKGLAARAGELTGLDESNPREALEALLVSGLLDLAAGAPGAEEKLQRVLDGERGHGAVDTPLEPAAALARLRLAGGDVDDALALTDEPMKVVTVKGIWLWAASVAPVRVQALVAAGRCEEATSLVTAFTKRVSGIDAPAPRAALATCRAILATSPGNTAKAAGLFARAAAIWDALPRPYDALLARERQAGCLLATGEDEAGLTLLAEVAKGMSDLGASGDASRVRRTLREHGAPGERPRRAGRPSYGDQISPREAEVLQLLVTGRTNREIADVLNISPRTVASHLDAAMRKLKVPTRAALAVRAVEAGMLPAAGRPVSQALREAGAGAPL